MSGGCQAVVRDAAGPVAPSVGSVDSRTRSVNGAVTSTGSCSSPTRSSSARRTSSSTAVRATSARPGSTEESVGVEDDDSSVRSSGTTRAIMRMYG